MPLDPEAGGTERITSLVAKGLSQVGHKCMGILVFNENEEVMTYDGRRVSDLYVFLKENRVDVVINQIAYAKWLLSDFLARGGARWHAEGGKIISCLHFDPCNPSYLQLLRSLESLTFAQKAVYVRQTVLRAYYKRRQRKEEGAVYNYIYDLSDAIVALSASHFPYMKQVMARDGYDRLHAIGNPLTFPKIAEKSILDNKTKTVVVCARMSEYHKRITLVLKAWKKVKRADVAKDWSLRIIGDGPDLARYKAMVGKDGITDVEFLGRQSPESYYETASILLLTSSAEGWGLTITEGLQYGVVPVVMDSSPVYRDIIKHLYNGLLTPDNDIRAFASSITRLMSDPRRLSAMRLNALTSASGFTIEKTIDKWSGLLEQLTKNNNHTVAARNE